MQQGKIAGAPTEISDEDELIMIEGRLVRIGSSDRFHFEVDVLKAGSGKGLMEAGKGKALLLLGLSAHEANRPPGNGVGYRRIKLQLGLTPEIGENASNQVLNGVMAPKNS